MCQLGTPGQVVVSAAIPQARFPIIVLGEVKEKKGALTSMTHSPGLSSQVDIQVGTYFFFVICLEGDYNSVNLPSIIVVLVDRRSIP